MAALTLPAEDHGLLRRALDRRITLVGNPAPGHYRVSSGSGGADHRLVVNPSGRIACDCQAGSHGRRCTHATYLAAFLAWQRQQEGGAQ